MKQALNWLFDELPDWVLKWLMPPVMIIWLLGSLVNVVITGQVEGLLVGLTGGFSLFWFAYLGDMKRRRRMQDG